MPYLEVPEMDFRSSEIRFLALEDQRLQLFKSFYLQAPIEKRQEIFDSVRSLARRSETALKEALLNNSDDGNSNRIIGMQVTFQFFKEPQPTTIRADLLLQAMEAWNRDEEFARPGIFE
jgi:hypothetical protein